MSKKGEKGTRHRADELQTQSIGQTQADIYGGSSGGVPGAFGPGGLSGERQKTIGQQQDTLGLSMGGIKDLQATGGYDPAQLSKLRAGYGAFATTGGMTPAEQARFVRSSTAGVPAAYKSMEQEAQRRRALTGGLGGGGQESQMARQLGQAAATADTGAQVQLAEQLRQGKLAGLGGEASLESGVAAGKQAGTGLANQLFNIQTGEISDQGRQILARLGLDSSNQQFAISVLQSLSQTPGVMDNIQRIAGMAGGAMAGMG